MHKEFLNVSEQVELLMRRGLSCDERSGQILMREGYYAVVNGYGKYFLDHARTQEAHEDRYLPNAHFRDVHELFLFDRSLRMLTFKALSQIEGMLRSLVSSAFLEAHDGPDDYLEPRCYTQPQHYLLGERNFERNLRQTINTLSRYANDHEDDERGRDDVRLAHYRENYDSVPLWVVFSDFSFGNLFHFLALMQRDEQEAVCEKLARALEQPNHAMKVPSRRALVNDVDLQVDVRNLCAHGERLFDASVGYRGAQDYADFVGMLSRYLTPGDARTFADTLLDGIRHVRDVSPAAFGAIDATNIVAEATQLRTEQGTIK
jgi:abortive infection bacteriophage resistance protein